jgi:hypothetical protein
METIKINGQTMKVLESVAVNAESYPALAKAEPTLKRMMVVSKPNGSAIKYAKEYASGEVVGV